MNFEFFKNVIYECCKLNDHDQKIRQTFTHDIRKHLTAVSIWLGLISSVYRDLHPWRSNQQPQIADPNSTTVLSVHIERKRRQINKPW